MNKPSSFLHACTLLLLSCTVDFDAYPIGDSSSSGTGGGGTLTTGGSSTTGTAGAGATGGVEAMGGAGGEGAGAVTNGGGGEANCEAGGGAPGEDACSALADSGCFPANFESAEQCSNCVALLKAHGACGGQFDGVGRCAEGAAGLFCQECVDGAGGGGGEEPAVTQLLVCATMFCESHLWLCDACDCPLGQGGG